MVGHSGLLALQAVDPTSLLELSGLVRGPIAFLLVLALGAVILRQYDGVVDRSLDASMDRPLTALGYGVAAHATLVFAGAYLTSQLAPLSVAGRSLGMFGLWIGGMLLAIAAALGFTVVGVAVLEIGLERPRWQGLLAGALLAGIAGLLDPLVGGLIWVITVSTGIGGPVRSWVWAADDVETVRAS